MVFVSSSQLDGESDDKVEHKGIIGKPFDRGPLLGTWDLAFYAGARPYNYLYPQIKESPPQRNCYSGMCSSILTSILHFIPILLLNVHEVC